MLDLCSHRRRALALAALAFMALASGLAQAQDLKPKLGPHAIPIQQAHDYLRNHAAPDYWALSPYYVPQATNSACSLAAISMLVNALRGLPPHAADRLVTQQALLAALRNDTWAKETAEGGSGVTWREFEQYVRLSLQAYGIDTHVEILKPQDRSAATLAHMRRVLANNESSDRDIVLVYFNQGVLTGDWDGPHISPIGAYDARQRRVLIMDVDRLWYVPYWSSDVKLLEAMLRPAPATHGPLGDETGGLIRVRLK